MTTLCMRPDSTLVKWKSFIRRQKVPDALIYFRRDTVATQWRVGSYMRLRRDPDAGGRPVRGGRMDTDAVDSSGTGNAGRAMKYPCANATPMSITARSSP